MRRGSIQQRHRRSCPRDEQGVLKPHRCHGNWGFVVEGGRRADGVRRQVSRAGFATKREAQAALDEHLARLRAGLADVQNLTVETYLTEWLAAKRNLRDTTRRNYATPLRRYLVPTLGPTKLIELRPHHLDSLYGDLIDGRIPGATAITVHHVHRTLRSALNSAVKRRLIPWNPALHVELPQRLHTAGQVWNPEDVRRFLDASADHQLGLVFHVIAFTGMRRGESLGLHWTDVHPEGPHLVVRCQIVNAAHGPALGLPKTRAGARVVPIDTFTSQLLEEHRKQQVLQQSAWGDGWADTGLVFTREDGAMVAPDQASRAFKQIVKRAGLPRIRLHDLRHTHASLALAAGVDIKVVSARLGHSTTAITSDLYTHVIPTVAWAAANAIAATIPPAAKRIPSAFLAQDDPTATDPDPP